MSAAVRDSWSTNVQDSFIILPQLRWEALHRMILSENGESKQNISLPLCVGVCRCFCVLRWRLFVCVWPCPIFNRRSVNTTLGPCCLDIDTLLTVTTLPHFLAVQSPTPTRPAVDQSADSKAESVPENNRPFTCDDKNHKSKRPQSKTSRSKRLLILRQGTTYRRKYKPIGGAILTHV